MLNPHELLANRIVELDKEPRSWGVSPGWKLSGEPLTVYTLIAHFAHEMSRHTDVFMDCEVGNGATIDPEEADALVGACSLLGEIAKYEPSLIYGPLQVNRQRWTRTKRNVRGPDHPLHSPRESLFIEPSSNLGQEVSTKPFYFGCYTSTVTASGFSMWRALMGPDGSMIYPLPWYTWEFEVDVDLKVVEILGAAGWVEFVCAYGRLCDNDGLLYPDWIKVAQEYDVVHITLPAIVAAQGFYFTTSLGVIPPVFWDVETAFWVKWRFSGACLVETVGGS